MQNCIKCQAEIPDNAVFCHLCGKKQIQDQRKHKKRANGTGTICKLSGNRARPWLARKNDVCIGTYATRIEAQKALDRLVDTGITEKFNLTFKQVHDLWLPEHERTIGTSAKGTYKTALNHCSDLYDKVFRSLRTSDFQKIIIDMENRGFSKSSCEKVLQLFGQLSEWAIREGILTTNYARFVTIVAEQKSTGKVFTSEDIKAIQKSKNIAADIVLILLATGCRPNELFSAVTQNCADNYFIGGSKTNAGTNRVIAVSSLGLDAYRRLRIKSAGKERLISGYAGNKTYANFAKREFKALMKEICREEYTPYDCRHTFITQATRSNIDPQILKRMVGHADLSTTDKYYTHMGLEDILSAAAGIDLTVAVSNKFATKKNPVTESKSKSS